MIWKATKIVIKGWIQISIEAKNFPFFFFGVDITTGRNKNGLSNVSRNIFFQTRFSADPENRRMKFTAGRYDGSMKNEGLVFFTLLRSFT